MGTEWQRPRLDGLQRLWRSRLGWWRRLGRSLGQLSRLGKPRRWRRLGRWRSQLRRRWFPWRWPEVTPETFLGCLQILGRKPRRQPCSTTFWRMGMSHVKVMILRCCMVFVLLALVISVASCNKSPEKPATTEVVQKVYASPDEASKALAEAAKAGSHDALVSIFGPGSQ